MNLDEAMEGNEVSYKEAINELMKHSIEGDEQQECLDLALIRAGAYDSSKIRGWL